MVAAVCACAAVDAVGAGAAPPSSGTAAGAAAMFPVGVKWTCLIPRAQVRSHVLEFRHLSGKDLVVLRLGFLQRSQARPGAAVVQLQAQRRCLL